MASLSVTVGWLTVSPDHMTAATLGGFRSKVSAPVVMRSEGRCPGGCVESVRGPEGVLSREEPRDCGQGGLAPGRASILCCFRSKSTNKKLYLKAIGVWVRLQRQLALVLSNLEANQAQFPISFWWFWNSDLLLVVRVATRSAQKSRTSTRNPHMRPLRQNKERNTTQGAQTRGLVSFRGPRLHNPPLPTDPSHGAPPSTERPLGLSQTPHSPLSLFPHFSSQQG